MDLPLARDLPLAGELSAAQQAARSVLPGICWGSSYDANCFDVRPHMLHRARYFSKVSEKGFGMICRQKGAIRIFRGTKVHVNGLTLEISNPDRDWILRADEMSVGTQVRSSERHGGYFFRQLFF